MRQATSVKPVCPECGASGYVYPAILDEYSTKWACDGCNRGIEEPKVSF